MILAPEKLKKTLELLPDQPGVYKYFDSEGKIIYVGKARSLKKRVSSYFNKNAHENRKTAILVSKIEKVDFTIVDSEMDALLLENSLIKEFQPRYNINLKDDKSYPFIRITTDRFPKVYAMRNPVQDGSEYFGPYASPRVMHTVLDLIKKLYPTRNCNLILSENNIRSAKFRVCLEYQIGNCRGPCEGHQTEEEYKEGIGQIRHLLRGHLSEVRNHLKKLMQDASESLKFELAQQYKDKLDMLERYQHRSTVVGRHTGDIDVFAVSSGEKWAFVSFLRVVEGMVVVSRNLEYKKRMAESDSDILEYALAEMNVTYGLNTKAEIIVPFVPDFAHEEYRFHVPLAGDKKKLLDLALKNAFTYRKERLGQYEKLNPEVRADRLMTLMQNDLRLGDQPRHIECFDNSNIQGKFPVSACVVFRNGKPARSEYRHFNVKSVEGPDDFATMREVIFRRYSRVLEENSDIPQLILIDGGKGQLSAAVESLKALNLYGKVAVVGIAKRLEEIYYPEDSVPLYIDKKSETLKILQQLRDEAHRFGITHHRKRRDKATVKTELTNIPGIGEQTARDLLRHFKSVKKVSEASSEQLAEVIGVSRGAVVFQFFHPAENES